MAIDAIYNFNLMIATTQLIVAFLCTILFFQEWRKQKRTENEQYIPLALTILYLILFITTILIIYSTFFTEELQELLNTKIYFIAVATLSVGCIGILIFIAERIIRMKTKHFFLIYFLCFAVALIILKIQNVPHPPGLFFLIAIPLGILVVLFVYKMVWKTSGQIRTKMIIMNVGFGIFILAFSWAILLILQGEYQVYLEIKGLILIASILTGYGFYTIPSFTEFDWKEKIRHLYLLASTTGICLFHHEFREKAISDQDLFGGSLMAIQSLMQEMIQSEKTLKVIDHEDAKILFERTAHIIAIMIADDDLYIIHQKLQQLLKEFEQLFGQIMENWSGNLDIFQPLPLIVGRIFEIKPEKN